jgi:protein-tyrosine phosphatase
VIDLHCHLLPGVDDGPTTAQEAVALARAFVAAGITRVAATPHVEPKYANTADTIHAAWLGLVTALGRERVPLEVVAGAELDLLHVQAFGDDELGRLRLGTSGPLLVECPFSPVVPQFDGLVERLLATGHQVLLAHPERSPAFLREPERLERLVGLGAMASLTGASFAGRFGRTAQQYAFWAVDEDLAHDVATDAHDAVRRPPVIDAPLQHAGYGWAAQWLTAEAPAAILAGAGPDDLPARPERRVTTGGWARMRRALGR